VRRWTRASRSDRGFARCPAPPCDRGSRMACEPERVRNPGAVATRRYARAVKAVREIEGSSAPTAGSSPAARGAIVSTCTRGESERCGGSRHFGEAGGYRYPFLDQARERDREMRSTASAASRSDLARRSPKSRRSASPARGPARQARAGDRTRCWVDLRVAAAERGRRVGGGLRPSCPAGADALAATGVPCTADGATTMRGDARARATPILHLSR